MERGLQLGCFTPSSTRFDGEVATPVPVPGGLWGATAQSRTAVHSFVPVQLLPPTDRAFDERGPSAPPPAPLSYITGLRSRSCRVMDGTKHNRAALASKCCGLTVCKLRSFFIFLHHVPFLQVFLSTPWELAMGPNQRLCSHIFILHSQRLSRPVWGNVETGIYALIPPLKQSRRVSWTCFFAWEE